MLIEQRVQEKLNQLVSSCPRPNIRYENINLDDYGNASTITRVEFEPENTTGWGTSCLHILKQAFGSESDYYINFNKELCHFPSEYSVKKAIGILKAAAADYAQGFAVDLRSSIVGEIFQDFVELAKRALAEGSKDVAAVLACAALEDVLKRFAAKNEITVDGKDMSEIVSALKAKGLVGGAQKTLLDTMPKIRNCAMHADWGKIQEPDVSSVIGFVEQFLITHF